MYELFPKNVRLLSTERYVDGGMSLGYFENFNLALHVNDSQEAVKSNRLLLKNFFKSMPCDKFTLERLIRSRSW